MSDEINKLLQDITDFSNETDAEFCARMKRLACDPWNIKHLPVKTLAKIVSLLP